MDFLNQIIKITTIDNRTLLGRLEYIDYLGYLYLTQSVEVFSKGEDFFSPLQIYQNSEFCRINFESKENSYQVIGSMVVKVESIMSMSMIEGKES